MFLLFIQALVVVDNGWGRRDLVPVPGRQTAFQHLLALKSK